jgi:SPP1 gp7 family putative phage head morphogenesis protein
LRPYLTKKGIQLSHKVTTAMNETFKAAGDDEDRLRDKVKALIDSMEFDWSDLPGPVSAILEPFAKGAAADGLAQIEVAFQTATDLANERATEWARARAAEMVGMKYGAEGALVENPNAVWAINESTRDMLNGLVTRAIDEGWSNDRLAKEIGNDEAFSDERAMLIARTETAMADVQGNAAAYKAAEDSGVELQKEWLTAGDDLVSEDCQANEDEGPIDLGDTFPSGAAWPPEHPNCRCDCLPVRILPSESG